MCHFITAVLPSNAPIDELDAIARRHGRQFEALGNPSIEAQLTPDQRYFFTTRGHCDCGTALGGLRRAVDRAPDRDAEAQRLLKKGWSKGKVARALEQRHDHTARSARGTDQAGMDELASWARLIAEVLEAGVREFGLLLHMYRGPLSERIQLHGTERVDVAAAGTVLGEMREDVLYLFRSALHSGRGVYRPG